VLLEGIVIFALFSAHFAVEFMLTQRHFNIINNNDRRLIYIRGKKSQSVGHTRTTTYKITINTSSASPLTSNQDLNHR